MFREVGRLVRVGRASGSVGYISGEPGFYSTCTLCGFAGEDDEFIGCEFGRSGGTGFLKGNDVCLIGTKVGFDDLAVEGVLVESEGVG